MFATMIVVVFVGVAFAIGFMVGRATAPGTTIDGPAPDRVAHPRPAAASLDDETFAAQLLVELAAGRKLEAIKLYRERTGLGLKEAKDAIEALERGA